MHRAVAYCRISQDRDETGLALDRQLADCRKLAVARGWEVAAEYSDTASAWNKRTKRPGFIRMMADVAGGRVQAVVVYDMDRLTRQPSELEPLIDACESGAIAFATCQGDINLASSDGRAMARVLVTMARKSSDDTSRRLKRERQDRIARGGHPGGWRKWGESKEHGVDPVESTFIRQAVALLLTGTSLRSTARQLNDAGSRTPRDKLWKPDQLKQSLLLDHSGIIAPADADQLARTLKRQENAIARGRIPHSLLGGLIRCGRCGAKLVPDGRGTYRCPPKHQGRLGCNGLGIRVEPTDALITRRVLGAFGSTRPVAFAPPDSDVRRLAELRRRVEETAADPDLDIALVKVRVAALEREIAATETRLQLAAERHAVAIQAEALRSRWAALDMDAKRTALRAVIERITVAPSGPNKKRFDSDRLTVEWVEIEEPDWPEEGRMRAASGS